MSELTVGGTPHQSRDIVTIAKDYLKIITQGRWRWYGNTDSKDIYLATPERSREFVMQFRRWGMQGAQPIFRNEEAQAMHETVADLVQFEVGDPHITGVKQIDGTVYRRDILNVDHPDAMFIAAAPELVRGLVAHVDLLTELLDARDAEIDSLKQQNQELKEKQ